MIFSYNFSLQGKSHIKREIPCQDSSGVREIPGDWHIAAIADGVGSARNSQKGSRIAVDSVLDFCEKYMPWDNSIISIKSMLRTAYNHAFNQIIREAEKSGEPVESYDTTLSVALYKGKRIIYGHSGDGAIIGLNSFGDYVQITQPQKGPDGISVIPLRFGYQQWKIDSYEEDLVAVLLMTDGMLETLCPYLLKNNPAYNDGVYVPLASFFADPSGIIQDEEVLNRIRQDINDFLTASPDYSPENFYNRLAEIYRKHIPEQAEAAISKIRERNYPFILMNAQEDDKTMAAIINTEVPLEDCSAEYYSDPDWAALREAWNRKAYPHLYADTEKDDKKDSAQEKNEAESQENAPNNDNTDNASKQNGQTTGKLLDCAKKFVEAGIKKFKQAGQEIKQGVKELQDDYFAKDETEEKNSDKSDSENKTVKHDDCVEKKHSESEPVKKTEPAPVGNRPTDTEQSPNEEKGNPETNTATENNDEISTDKKKNEEIVKTNNEESSETSQNNAANADPENEQKDKRENL